MKAQADETAKHKAEIAALYEKNLKAAINSETASLNAKIEWTTKENARLQSQLEKKKSSLIWYAILFIIGIVIGYLMTK